MRCSRKSTRWIQGCHVDHDDRHRPAGELRARTPRQQRAREKRCELPDEYVAQSSKMPKCMSRRRAATLLLLPLLAMVSACGTVAVEQANWDAFIEKAFTTTKTPGETAADGATIKLRIVDVLKTAKVL